MAVTRSPKYPQLSFREALDRIQKVYAADKWHPTTDETIAKHLGYKGLNGASLGVIATLKRYGMLASAGEGKWKVSEDAVTIIEAPHEHEEWPQAMLRSAFRPQIFEELREEFGAELPSNATLRHSLIKKKYNPSVADDVIRVYRETLEFVSQQIPDYVENDSDVVDPTASFQIETERQPIASSISSPTSQIPADAAFTATEKFEQRISPDCRVVILYEGKVTKEAIRKLRKYLELSEDEYPSSASENEVLRTENLPNKEDEANQES